MNVGTATGFVGGIGGLTEQPVDRLPRIDFGPVKLEQVPTYLSRDEHGGLAELLGADGIIGTEVLRRYTAIWNYPSGELILEPNVAIEEPYRHAAADRAGVYFIAGGTALEEIRVDQVAAGGPAAQAGLRSGDILVEIDGVDASTLTLESLRRRLAIADSSRLRLRRGTEVVQMILRLPTQE